MSAASPFRISRLQFSLRGLLAFMLFVSVGIVVYRWPWEEVNEIGPMWERTKTRYHRGWNGKPVKHGLEVEGESKWNGWERWYDEGDLRIEKAWSKGKVSTELNYLGGKRHGFYRELLGPDEMPLQGQYHHGQKHGEWKYEPVDFIVREQWRDDLRHGRTIWETKSGRLLQSAEYERGRLTKWNDKPVVEELERWLNANMPDVSVRRMLLTPVANSSDLQITFMPYGDVSLRFRMHQPEQQEAVVHFERIIMTREKEWSGRLVGESLLDESLEFWQTFAFRYNRLNVVPITAASLEWQDRTGVYGVQFEAGSEQEAFWLQNVIADPLLAEFPATRFRQILSAPGHTPIDIDVTAIEDAAKPPLKTSPSRLNHWSARVRRDLLGQHLNREGCYVEQEGNKLIIKRLAERE